MNYCVFRSTCRTFSRKRFDDFREIAADGEWRNDSVGESRSEFANADNKRKIRRRRRPTGFTCNFCSRRFQDTRELLKHFRRQHFHREIHCLFISLSTVCIFMDCSFYSFFFSFAEVDRNRHGPNGNECEICGNCYSDPEYLEQHIVDFHEKYKCNKCGRCTGEIDNERYS